MNRTKTILIIILIFFSFRILGQTYIYNELSDNFIFKTDIKRNSNNKHNFKCNIKITIEKKTDSKVIQTISVESDMMVDDSAFIQYNNVRSYITGINKNKSVIDWDYGDLIIADFNFDDKEDFAVKKEVGGNGGPLYIYYVQNEESSFVLNEFLCDKLECFPQDFDRESKTFTTICRETAVSLLETIYKYDSLVNNWNIVSRRRLK